MSRLEGHPFVKWVGGKTQMLPILEEVLPFANDGKKWTYVEPFGGGGALMFDILENYKSHVGSIIFSDTNFPLINAFECIKSESERLKEILRWHASCYVDKTDEERSEFYYKTRDRINAYLRTNFNAGFSPLLAALFIFLNKTCFNGLWRVNKSGLMNSPHGRYSNPTICDSDNIDRCSALFNDNLVTFLCCDYKDTLEVLEDSDKNVLFYFDPPYRPVSKTSAFTAYTSSGFCDVQQVELKNFCDKITADGHKFILSNSFSDDGFFQDLYREYNIREVEARRSINSKGDKRGPVKELIITNY